MCAMEENLTPQEIHQSDVVDAEAEEFTAEVTLDEPAGV